LQTTPRKNADAVDMEDAHGGSLIGKTPGTAGRPRVRRFFTDGAEDQAPGGGGVPLTPETNRGASGTSRAPNSGPSPADNGNGNGNQRRRKPDAVDDAKVALDALGVEPDKKEDYKTWLEHQKAKWVVIRCKRKRKRCEDEAAAARVAGATPGLGRSQRPRLLGPGGLGAFAETKEKVLARSAWQVISLEPEQDLSSGAPKPGRFAAWLMCEGTMYRVTLRMDRKLAVATRAPDREGDLGVGGKKRVVATLPRGARANHVYEVVMDEKLFVSGLEVMDLLTDPNVLGVFERHVPLIEAAIQKLGCVSLMNETQRQLTKATNFAAPQNGEYPGDALDSRATAEFGYLPLASAAGGPGTAENANSTVQGLLRHVTVYHCGGKDKGVFVLHTPFSNKGLMVIVAPGALTANGRVRESAKEVTSRLLEKLHKRSVLGAGGDTETQGDGTETQGMSLDLDDDLEGDDLEGTDGGAAAAEGGAAAALASGPSTSKWTVHYARRDANAGSILSKALSLYLESNKGPCVCLLEASTGVAYDAFVADDDDGGDTNAQSHSSTTREGVSGRFTKMVPALARVPVVCVPSNPGDDTVITKALGWQVGAAATSVTRVLAHTEWLSQRVAISRYAHIPIGNLKQDWCLHVADTFFARALRDDGQLLWTGVAGAPDLGGGVGDGAVGLDDALATARAEVITPGAYRSVCVELKAHHLAVCAIANAHLLNDLERGALLGYEDTSVNTKKKGGVAGASTSRGGHEAASAFSVLRKLVNDWLVDATERRNGHADQLLGQLRRWLLSDDSQLREPALRHLVELCVKKTFTLLLAEIKKLGATVIHADAQRIVICTGKTRLSSASAFIEGIRGSLRRRELFSWLELEPTKQWHSLLFRGPFDYGGLIAAELPGAEKWAGHDTQGPDDFELDGDVVGATQVQDAQDALDMHWNIASFLPESLREHFEVIVSEFLFKPFKRERGGGDDDDDENDDDAAVALDEEGDEALEQHPSGYKNGTKHQADLGHDEHGVPLAREALALAEEQRAAWLGGQVEGYFSQRILRLVGEIQKHLGPGGGGGGGGNKETPPEHAFPTPPGSHLSDHLRGSPALAFVKTLCAVLSLDQSVVGPVALLRKNALKLLRVPEYAPEASFREPCVTFVLRDAVCGYCGDCRDVDLCRDPRLVEDGTWECTACACPYDTRWIESALVGRVNEKLRLTQTQDLRCVRDGAIKVGRLASRCTCGGLFKCVEHKVSAADDLNVMKSIAQQHGFEVLKDVVEWVSEMSPNLLD
jgi:DNA polymerase epsilon subunit 1|tara:strand:+ start:5500 stop:9312 length:3813 start_codon:yes stop_codon:yes gene_type:complete